MNLTKDQKNPKLGYQTLDSLFPSISVDDLTKQTKECSIYKMWTVSSSSLRNENEIKRLANIIYKEEYSGEKHPLAPGTYYKVAIPKNISWREGETVPKEQYYIVSKVDTSLTGVPRMVSLCKVLELHKAHVIKVYKNKKDEEMIFLHYKTGRFDANYCLKKLVVS